jgi:uncharacterized Fe-S cluster-containing radical SAM superfamily protein
MAMSFMTRKNTRRPIERKFGRLNMNNSFPFDPISRSSDVEKIVMQGDKRRYYRFRYAKFYGGIITADSVGCNLLCAFCWNYKQNVEIESTTAKLYSPQEVANKINALMAKHEIEQFRISGCEAFLGAASAKHLGEVIKLCKGKAIIETNGVMIGHDPSLLDFIPKKGVHFRITIKADSKKDFEHITGAKASTFKYQLDAIKALTDRNRPFTLAFMKQFVSAEKLGTECDKALVEFEDKTFIATDIEGLMYYPQNIKSMKDRGVTVLYDKKERDRILNAMA